MTADERTLQPSANDWGYRPHLDGLRCLAVYLVVLFHSGSGRVRGGFVGVDLFFVLSGFLVTNVLLTDVSVSGGVRFARFYARRARRLIPAASVAILGVCGVAIMVLSSLDRTRLIPDARSASLWFANWHFIAEANDYFAVGEPESPLLHFWSLAIEEQFYLVFPVVLYATIRLARGRLSRVVALISVLMLFGLGAQLWWAQRDVNHAYLGTDARLYQPLAGALLAIVLWRFRLPAGHRRLKEVLFGGSIVGLVLIASWLIDVDASTRGVLATVASLGVVAGGELAPSSWVAQSLAWKPIRYLGSISYGTYLWHWPVVAFAHRLVSLTPLAMFVFSAAIGTGLAALSYEVLEQPVRTGARLRSLPGVTVAIGVVTALVVGLVVSPALLNTTNRPLITPLSVGTAAAGSTPVPDLDWAEVANDKPTNRACTRPDGSDCLLRRGSGPTVFLIGDSHAQMWSSTLMILAEKYDWTLYLGHYWGCNWPNGLRAGWATATQAGNCDERRQIRLQQVDAVDPDLIVLTERGINDERIGQLDTTVAAYDGLSGDDVLRRASIDTVGAWAAPGRRFLLIEPIPEVAGNSLGCLSGAEFVENCTFPAVSGAHEEAIYRDLASSSNDIFSVDVDSAICPDACPAIIDGVVVRRDRNHLTEQFADRLAPLLDEAVRELGAAE